MRVPTCLVRASLLVVAAALPACGADEAAPPVRSATTSAASPTSGPTTPSPPELPAAATTGDAPGAEAFVRHWVELLNYAYRTGDTQPVGDLTLPECDLCTGNIDDIQTAYRSGGAIEGGDVTVTLVRSPPPDDDGTVIVSTLFAQADLTDVSATGERTTQPGFAAERAGFVLDFIDGNWTVVGIGSE